MHARCTHDALSANLEKARGQERPFESSDARRTAVLIRFRPLSAVLPGSRRFSRYGRRFGGRSEEVAEFLEATPQYVRRHPERLAQSYGIPHFAHLKHGLHGNCRKEERGGETVASSSSRGSSPRRRSVDSFRGPSASLRQKRPTEAPDLRREHKASPFVGKAGSHPNGLGLGRPKSQRSNLVGIIDLNDAKPELLREIFGRHGNLHVPIRFDERTGKSVGLGHGFISNSKRTSDAHREAAGGIEHASGGTLCRCPTRARKRFKRVQRSDSPDYVMEICRNFHALLWQIFSEVCRTERDARVLDAHVLDASGNAARRPKRVGKEAREEPLRSSRTDESRFRRGPSASPAHAL